MVSVTSYYIYEQCTEDKYRVPFVTGNHELRTLLIETAHRLIRTDERWTKLAARLSQRGKPTGVVIAAVANRWVRWLFHQAQPSCLAA